MAALQPVLGIVALLGLGWLMSVDRRAVRWRPVLVGLALQWALALVILRTPVGPRFFDAAQTLFRNLIDLAKQGAKDVVGPGR